MPPTVREVLANAIPVPDGVLFHRLVTHSDDRGDFTELYRASWDDCIKPKQWNIVHSKGNVLRGVHVHSSHEDLLTVIAGEMLLGLQDMRSGNADAGLAAMVRISFDDPFLVSIPRGVAHGFFFAQPGSHLYCVDREFDGSDELGCHWADADLRLNWPCSNPELSKRDQHALPCADMLAQLNATAEQA